VKVLVVDDNEVKSQAIAEAIREALGDDQPHSVNLATTMANGVRLLNLVAFDLIVLDLMLPYLQGARPDSRAGLELLRQLRSEEGLNRTTAVIGISAFPDEIELSRANFEELGIIITKFDEEGSWKRVLLRVLEEVKGRATTHIDVDFLIFCALEKERNGFAHTSFEKISEAIVCGLNVHYVRLPGQPELFGGVVRLSQMGLVAAAFETTMAMGAFRSKVLCMTGICAGFPSETILGQLVVASPAWEYQAGKWSENGFEIAPMQVPLRPSTRSVIDHTLGREGFVRSLESGLDTKLIRPSRQSDAILAPFATGSAVIADARRLEHILRQHRKVAALDTETFGVYYAAHESTSSAQHFFSIKCVVDLADADKSDDLHPYGCVVSARATEQLIRALLTPI
jgi:adenosylhomocysteine nucleosidase